MLVVFFWRKTYRWSYQADKMSEDQSWDCRYVLGACGPNQGFGIWSWRRNSVRWRPGKMRRKSGHLLVVPCLLLKYTIKDRRQRGARFAFILAGGHCAILPGHSFYLNRMSIDGKWKCKSKMENTGEHGFRFVPVKKRVLIPKASLMVRSPEVFRGNT